MHIRLRTVVAALSLFIAGAISTAQAQQTSTNRTYSATAIHALPGQAETSGKIVKSGQNLRLEFDQNGQTVIQILRPADGVMYVLDPKTRTYIEIRGQTVPATATQGYTTPCPDQTQMTRCERVGTDTVSGIKVERWILATQSQSRPLVILWDSTRRHALRQEFPDGSVMAMKFKAMKDLNGRATEHWAITITAPNQPASHGDWWFDPKLRVVVREALPDGEVRRLENIIVGPVDPMAFQIPEGWQKQDPSAPSTLQVPQLAPATE